MSDIVGRLREVANRPDSNYPAIMEQAADTITALRAEVEQERKRRMIAATSQAALREVLRSENERLRAALVTFADHFGPLEDNHMLHEGVRRCFALARAALTKGDSND